MRVQFQENLQVLPSIRAIIVMHLLLDLHPLFLAHIVIMSYIVSELRTGFHGAGLAFMYYGLASLDTLDADQFISKQYGQQRRGGHCRIFAHVNLRRPLTVPYHTRVSNACFLSTTCHFHSC